MQKLFSKFKDSGPDISRVDTIIGPDSMFQGVLFLKNTVCVEGNFKGRIESKNAVIIGKSGMVEGDITANYIIVNGDVTGTISAYQQFELGATGKVIGNVEAKAIMIEKGGVLQGFCRMLTSSDEETQNSRMQPRQLNSLDTSPVHLEAGEMVDCEKNT